MLCHLLITLEASLYNRNMFYNTSRCLTKWRSTMKSYLYLNSVDLCMDLSLVKRRPDLQPETLLELATKSAFRWTHLKRFPANNYSLKHVRITSYDCNYAVVTFWHYEMIWPRNTNRGERLITVDPLIKVACFVMKENNIFNLKMS